MHCNVASLNVPIAASTQNSELYYMPGKDICEGE
jgi:hypothetical protein